MLNVSTILVIKDEYIMQVINITKIVETSQMQRILLFI